MAAVASGHSADDWKKPRAGGRIGATPSAPSRNRRLIPAAILFLGLLGTAAGIAVFVLRDDTKPLLLAVSISEHDAVEWPVNAYAKQSADRLRALFDRDSTQAFQDQEKNRFEASLARAVRQGRSPVVIHLCTCAVAWDDTVYLIPGNADPLEPTSWIGLDDVLKPLQNQRGNILLILDLRPAVAADILGCGLDVDRELERLLTLKEQRGELTFPVLNAGHGPLGPVLLPSRSTTLFSLALVDGLRGTAENYGSTGKADQTVFVRELANYVMDRINGSPQAASRCRLHGTFTDFPLLHVPTPTVDEADATAPQAEPADRRAALDEFRRAGVSFRFPQLDRLARWTLGRAEQQRFAGADSRETDELAKRAATLLKAVPPPVRLPPTSVAVATLFRDADEAKRKAATDAVAPLLESIQVPVKPDEFKAGLAAFQAKWKAGLLSAAVDEELLALFDRVEEPDQEQFQRVAAILQSLRPARSGVETATIELLATAPISLQERRWPKGMASEILKTAVAAEAACAVEAGSLPWIERAVGDWDRQRRELTLRLFDRDRPDADYARADDGTSTLRKLVVIRTGYRTCRRIGDIAAGLRQELRAARVVLSDLNDDGCARIGPNGQDVPRLVQQLVDAMLEAEAGLKDASGDFDADRWKKRTLAVRDRRTELQAQFLVPANASYLNTIALLRGDQWTAPHREELKAKAVAWERAILDAPAAKNPSAAPTTELTRVGTTVLPWSLLHAVERLRASAPGRPGAEERYRAMKTMPPTAALIQAWSRSTCEDYRKLTATYRTTADLKLRADLGWLVPPGRLAAWPRGNPTEPDPNPEHAEAVRLEAEASRGFRRLRYRTEAETFRGPAESMENPQPYWKVYIDGFKHAGDVCDAFRP